MEFPDTPGSSYWNRVFRNCGIPYRMLLKRELWSIPLFALFLVFIAPLDAQPAPTRVYTLASGNSKGVYYPLAQDIAAVAHRAGVEIRVLPSEGSAQNLTWLADRRADLALVQSDTASDAYGGHGSFLHPFTGLRVITPLYTEAVHILIHRPLYIRRLGDLRGKRIAVGPAGSGTEANATQVLAAAGLTLTEVEARRLSIEETMVALRQGQLDAAFVTSGVPTTAVEGVLADGFASLFEPDQDLLDRLRAGCPFFIIKNIERYEYPHLREQVTTVGIRALLVGRIDLPPTIVDRLVRTLSESRDLATKYHLTEVGGSIDDIAIPIFDTAQHFYMVQSWHHHRKLIAGILAAVLALALVSWRFQRGIWRLLRRAEFFRVGLYFSVLWLTGSFTLYWTEHRVNENYSSLLNSMWSGLITIFSLAGKEPLTFEGRVVGIVIFLLGLAGLLWFTERLASFYIEKKLIPLFRGGFARMHKMKDHYVIAGWNEKGPGIVAQLHGDDLDDRRLIVVLAKEGQTVNSQSPGPLQIERGDRVSEQALRKVQVQAAHSVIILSDPLDPATDAATILAILAIRKICADLSAKQQVSVVAEIVDPQHVDLAMFAGADMGGLLEVVSSNVVGQGLITQTAVHPGLSKVYRKLLELKEGNSEIHRMEVPKLFWGQTFDDLVADAVQRRSSGIYVLPIGIQRGPEVYINPAKMEGTAILAGQQEEQPSLLQKGDFLFAICDSPRDLKKLYHST